LEEQLPKADTAQLQDHGGTVDERATCWPPSSNQEQLGNYKGRLCVFGRAIEDIKHTCAYQVYVLSGATWNLPLRRYYRSFYAQIS